MIGPSSWLRAILFLFCWGLVHASSQSPCSDLVHPQPIAINLSLDSVTAVCVPSIDQFVVLAVAYPRSIDSPLPKYAETTTLLRMNYLQERNIKPNRYSSIFGKFFGKFFASKSSTPPDLNEKPSSEQITLGFIEAFERVKNISSANSGTNITSAVISFPRFFSFEVHKLAVEAAQRAGIFPVHSTSPHQLFSMLENILEENITAVRRYDYTPKLLIIDYGLLYFDVQTHGRRCHLNISLDWMGCMNIIYRLVNRVVSTNADIQQQLDQGASYNTLKSAVYRAQYLMKMDRDVESWDEKVSKEDRPERWALELDDWWTGQQKDAFISREDIESAEAEYVSDLAELLDNLLICLEEAKTHDETEANQSYLDFDKIIVLGNLCDRSLIVRALKKSIGEHARITGGSSESDVILEALAGARFAFKFHEAELRIRENMETQLTGHVDL